MSVAYDEEYLPLAQRVMGDMLDYAVNTLDYDLTQFYHMFLVSDLARQIAIGNPTFVAGKNGCELAKYVLANVRGIQLHCEDLMYLDKSPEYWCGWVLAYCQWKRGESFKRIEEAFPVELLVRLYDPLHEADIVKVVEVFDEKMEKGKEEAFLRRMRRYAGLSQSQLSREADVPLRQIQLFEQGERQVEKAQARTVVKLANALKCRPEELM